MRWPAVLMSQRLDDIFREWFSRNLNNSVQYLDSLPALRSLFGYRTETEMRGRHWSVLGAIRVEHIP